MHFVRYCFDSLDPRSAKGYAGKIFEALVEIDLEFESDFGPDLVTDPGRDLGPVSGSVSGSESDSGSGLGLVGSDLVFESGSGLGFVPKSGLEFDSDFDSSDPEFVLR